jgi:hypothetical protein
VALTPSAFTPPVTSVRWTPCFRLIPSRFPPVALFERVADPADWEAIILVESLTNDRLRQEAGEISLVPAEQRVSGPGASYIMAPFTHLSDAGGRFSTRRFGAYYAGRELETAIRETVYHRERFLRATSEGPMELDMRELRATLDGALHDLRGLRAAHPSLYHSSDYTASQQFATALRDGGSGGIAYDSVRHEGGECVAVFRPTLLGECRQAAHHCYVWDGTRIVSVYRKSALRDLQ